MRVWLALLLAVVPVGGEDAGTPEAKRKKIKMRSSKQLRQLLAEAEVTVPAGTTLEGLREIAYQNDVGINGEVAKSSPLVDGTEVSTALFRLLDQNGDGQLGRDEFAESWSNLKEQAVKTGMGKVSKTDPTDIFGTMDVDENGLVNQTEASYVLATMLEVAQDKSDEAAKKKARKDKPVPKPPPGFEPEKAKKELQGMAEQLFRLLDTNFDQTLDKDEIQMLEELGTTSGAGQMPFSPDVMFKQMDTDSDGAITRPEAAELFKILGDGLGF